MYASASLYMYHIDIFGQILNCLITNKRIQAKIYYKKDRKRKRNKVIRKRKSMFIICTNIMSSLDYTSVNPWMPNLRPRNLDPSGVRVYPKPKIHRIMRITEQAEGSRGEAMKLLNEQRRLQRNHWKKLSNYAIFHKEWSSIQKNCQKMSKDFKFL